MQKIISAYRYLFDAEYGSVNHFLGRWIFLRGLGLILVYSYASLVLRQRPPVDGHLLDRVNRVAGSCCECFAARYTARLLRLFRIVCQRSARLLRLSIGRHAA